ncbi:hypothetical protein FGO68_gene1681 [Halteria grandinella]|uniref:Casein kinase I n=1 Tax=Halteria grandinella TaxID=5974 RepID=A0A8J8T792_HALGN|nr:hypothetical protein FGO68_gene1681 [Halteria grandinella]
MSKELPKIPVYKTKDPPITLEYKGQSYTLSPIRLDVSKYTMTCLYVSKNADPKYLAVLFDSGDKRGGAINQDHYLQSLQHLSHTPAHFETQYSADQVAVIHQYIENSLSDYPGMPIQICRQMLQAVRELHQAGIVHRDVRPGIFRIGEGSKVYIVEYSQCAEFRPQDHRKEEGKAGEQNNPTNASKRAQEEYTLSRRNDIESLGYTFLAMVDSRSMIWQSCKDPREIYNAKQEFLKAPSDQLSDVTVIVRQFIISARNLSYTEEPDYEHFMSYLNQIEAIQEQALATETVDRLLSALSLQQVHDAIHSSNEQFYPFHSILDALLKKDVQEIATSYLQISQEFSRFAKNMSLESLEILKDILPGYIAKRMNGSDLRQNNQNQNRPLDYQVIAIKTNREKKTNEEYSLLRFEDASRIETELETSEYWSAHSHLDDYIGEICEPLGKIEDENFSTSVDVLTF